MNEKNLIPFSERTESEQREIRSKGGKASGVSRSFKAAVKKKFKDNPELFDDIVDMLTEETFSHNLKATEMLFDLMGESVQRENLKLKREELKLKKKQLSVDNGANDLVKEWIEAVKENEQ